MTAASSKTTRRDFLEKGSGAVAAGVLTSRKKAFSETGKPPNILWIMTDEQRADTLGCYGNSWAHSPHLDGLAAAGTLFRKAYVQSPICVPSRAAVLTGKYGHTCEVLHNDYFLNLTSWHRRKLADAIETSGREAFQRRIETLGRQGATRFEEDFGVVLPHRYQRIFGWASAVMQEAGRLGLFNEGPRHKMFPEILAEQGYHTVNVGKLHHRAPYTGFQEHPEVPDHEYSFWFGLRRDFDPREYEVLQHPSIPAVMAGTFPGPASETTTAKWTDLAIDYLRNRIRPPFLLRLSLRAPHTPVLPPVPYDRMFDPAAMPIPRTTAEEMRETSRYDRERWFHDEFNEKERRRTWASYFGLAAFVDDQIGRLLKALAESPHARNTIVVFSVDHGTHLGEHGLYQKSTFYEESVRVPFILSWPGQIPRGKEVEDLTEMIDLAPTLFRLCGIDTPADMEGRDLVPAMRGEGTSPRKAVFSEMFAGEANIDWLRGEPPGTIRRMVRTRQWKMSVYHPQDPLYGPDGALYNLIEDPAETRNLYYSANFRPVVRRLRETLLDWTGG